MKFSRIFILSFICSLSVVGRSTSSPNVRTAYLQESGGSTGLLQTAGLQLRGSTGMTGQLGVQSEAQLRRRLTLFVPPISEIPPLEPPPADIEPAPAMVDARPRFRGEYDDEILTKLCSLSVKSIRPLGGGSSIKLRVMFTDGSQAAVKPNQLRITRYQAEVAAYKLAKALGLSVVPPSCVRTFTKEALQASMPKDLRERMDQELVVDEKGNVKTAVIQWVPGLRNMKLEQADWWRPLLKQGEPIPSGKHKRIAEISTLLLFDYLLLNFDRWSGGNTTEADGEMIYIDQGASLGPDKKHGHSRLMLKTLKWSERFPRGIAQSLFQLDLPALRSDFGDLVTDDEWESFLYRVEHARAYIRALKKQYPKDALF
jgi:hypothetical protein